MNWKFSYETGSSMTHFHKFNNESFFVHLLVRAREIVVWVQYYGDIWREREFTATIFMQNAKVRLS